MHYRNDREVSHGEESQEGEEVKGQEAQEGGCCAQSQGRQESREEAGRRRENRENGSEEIDGQEGQSRPARCAQGSCIEGCRTKGCRTKGCCTKGCCTEGSSSYGSDTEVAGSDGGSSGFELRAARTLFSPADEWTAVGWSGWREQLANHRLAGRKPAKWKPVRRDKAKESGVDPIQ